LAIALLAAICILPVLALTGTLLPAISSSKSRAASHGGISLGDRVGCGRGVKICCNGRSDMVFIDAQRELVAMHQYEFSSKDDLSRQFVLYRGVVLEDPGIFYPCRKGIR
jgi:hypothetical protein